MKQAPMEKLVLRLMLAFGISAGALVTLLGGCQRFAGIEDTEVIPEDSDAGAPSDAAIRPDGSSEPSSFRVVSTLPDDNQGVSRSPQIRFTFNQTLSTDLDPGTLVTLHEGSGQQVTSSVAFEGRAALLVPEQQLEPLSTYTARVSKELTSSSGTTLQADYTWTFVTEDRRWSQEVPLESASAIYAATLAEDGDAMVAWHDAGNVWVRQYAPATGWQEPLQVAQETSSFQMEGDGSGDVLLVWTNAVSSDVYAKWYRTGGGWFNAKRIGSNSTGDMALELDRKGGAVAAWSRELGNDEETVSASRYISGTEWQQAITSSFSDHSVDEVDIETLASGAAVIAFHWSTDYELHGWKAHIYDDNGLSAAEGIDTFAESMVLTSDEDGTFHAAWVHYIDGGSYYRMYMRTWNEQSGWSNEIPLMMVPYTDDLAMKDISVDKGKDIWLNWGIYDEQGAGVKMLQVKKYVMDSGWNEAMSLSIGPIDYRRQSTVQLSDRGDHMLLYDDGGDLQVRRYRDNTGWVDAGVIASSIESFQALTNRQGKRLIVYSKSGALYVKWFE